MRRVQSAPAFINMDAPAVRVDDEDDDHEQHRRANSNGCPASPTGATAIARMWHEILHRPIQVAPVLVVENMGNRLFTGIYLFPHFTFIDGGAFPAVRPNEWHSSIATGYFVGDLMWRDIGARTIFTAWRRHNIEVRLTARLAAIWGALFSDMRAIVSFEPAPFSYSWGFAVPVETKLGNALAMLQITSEHIIRYEFEGRLRLRRRRAIHVSWN